MTDFTCKHIMRNGEPCGGELVFYCTQETNFETAIDSVTGIEVPESKKEEYADPLVAREVECLRCGASGITTGFDVEHNHLVLGDRGPSRWNLR